MALSVVGLRTRSTRCARAHPYSIVARSRPNGALLLFAFMSVSSVALPAEAQQDVRRFEVGVSGAAVRFQEIDPALERERRESPPLRTPPEKWIDPALGIRFIVNVNKAFGAEAEVALLPRFAGFTGIQERGGAKAQIVAGPRYCWRRNRIGIAATAKAGIIDMQLAPAVLRVSGPLEVEGERDSVSPMVGFGGGLEMNLSPRIIGSVDAGNFFVWYHPRPQALNPSFVRQNLYVGASLRWSFGRPLGQE